jgi:acyl-coenzyme A synthetase/AMP-(fatty) acid ligase
MTLALSLSNLGDSPVLINDDCENISYEQLIFHASRWRSVISQIGICQNSRVACYIPTDHFALTLLLALLMDGHTCGFFDCKSTSNERATQHLLFKPTHIIDVESVESEYVQQANDVHQARNISFSALLAHWNSFERDIPFAWPDGWTARLCMETSGTTGKRKLIVHKAEHLVLGASAFLKHQGIALQSLRFWNFYPISYLAGSFNTFLIPVVGGHSVVVSPRFDGKSLIYFWREVSRLNINRLWITPSLIQSLLRLASSQPHHRVPTTQIGFVGMAGSLDEDIRRFRQVFNVDLLDTYGTSETLFIGAETMAVRGKEALLNNLLEGVELVLKKPLISSEEFLSTVRPILVRTPWQASAVIEQSGQNAVRCRDTDGTWVNTGDLAEEKRGLTLLAGRSSRTVKRSGVLVSAEEIEHTIYLSGIDLEVVAVPVSDPVYGENLVVVIAPVTGIEGDLAFSVKRLLIEKLSLNKQPRGVVVVGKIPRGAAGKPIFRDVVDLEPVQNFFNQHLLVPLMQIHHTSRQRV